MTEALQMQLGGRRGRRIADALDDMPEEFPTTRIRGPRDRHPRHLETLRRRLNYLVRIEEQHGDTQNHLHHNRAERNALIWALKNLAPCASGLSATRAWEIADEAMLNSLHEEGILDGDLDRIDFADGDYMPASDIESCGTRLREAIDWLLARGYIEIAEDEYGKFVRVVAEPGDVP